MKRHFGNGKRLSQKVSAVALNVFYRKQVAPLIRPKLRFVHLPPKGKAISKAVVLNSNDVATIRYETGEARPQGEAYERGINIKFKRFCYNPLRNGRSPPPKGKVISKAVVLNSNDVATIRYETGETRPQGEAA